MGVNYDKIYLDSIEKDQAKVKKYEQDFSEKGLSEKNLDVSTRHKDFLLVRSAMETVTSNGLLPLIDSAKTKEVRDYIQLKCELTKKKELLEKTGGRDPFTVLIEKFLKKKTADQVAKSVNGELPEFNCELGSVMYGNREAIVSVDGIEESEVLHVDNYNGKNILVRG